MANTKISELPALTSANLQDADLLPIVDVDTNNDGNASDKATKSITIASLKSGLGTYSDGSIIKTNTIRTHASAILNIYGSSGTTAYPVNITGGGESGDNGDGAGVTISGGTSGGDSGTGGDVTIQGGAGESTNGKVILGGSDTLKIEVNSSISMGNNAINATTAGFTSTSGNISTGGTITSTSTTARPVQNDEANDSAPIRNIRNMTQADYTALGSKVANTLYIIVG